MWSSRLVSRDIAQLETAIHALDQSSPPKAALAEQAWAASTTLSEQARRLASDVNFFRMDTEVGEASFSRS
ncbi:hypothetical protein [Actimicrobium antarcticum]|uniref:Uncharacterized protein n=1 Tax=Actimicrobium antarcticum TaxID=1051899 RepID=A0ABP7T8G9_9BURK